MLTWLCNTLPKQISSLALGIYCILLAAVPTGIILGQSTIYIDQDFQETTLAGHIEYYIDDKKELRLEDLLPVEGQWTEHTGQRLFFSPSVAHHWVTFTIKNIEPWANQIYLNIAYAHIADYQLYLLFDGGRKEILPRQGDNYPYDRRLVNHPHFVHSIMLDSLQSVRVVLSFDQEGQDLQLPLFLSSEKHFFEQDQQTNLLIGFCLGLCIVIIIGLLSLYYFYRVSYILLQVLTSISSAFYVMAEEGYGFAYLWPSFPTMNGISRPLFLAMVALLSLLFTFQLLRIKTNIHPWYYRGILFYIGCYVLYMILVHPLFLLPINTETSIGAYISIFLLMTLVLFLLNLGICLYYAIRYRNPDARILSAIFALLVIALSIRTLSFHGQSASHFLISHTGLFTLSLQTVLIGAYLFKKSFQIIKENQKIRLKIAHERQIASETIIDSLHSERERISMDIHDSLTSLVTAAKMNLESLQDKYASLIHDRQYHISLSLLKDISHEMRTISHNLMPKTLRAFGLVAELTKRIALIEASHKLKIELEAFGFSKRLPERIEIELYHISMELIDNVLKYAEADHFLIQINQYEKEINVIYEDNGKGFDVNKISSDSNGIANIKSRTKWLHGEVDIDSCEGIGTTITLNIPIITVTPNPRETLSKSYAVVI